MYVGGVKGEGRNETAIIDLFLSLETGSCPLQPVSITNWGSWLLLAACLLLLWIVSRDVATPQVGLLT